MINEVHFYCTTYKIILIKLDSNRRCDNNGILLSNNPLLNVNFKVVFTFNWQLFFGMPDTYICNFNPLKLKVYNLLRHFM